MWLKFKWDMFVTSFIPLWTSIIIFDIWDMIVSAIDIFSKETKFTVGLCSFALDNVIQISSIVAIFIVLVNSVLGINRFLREREKSNQNQIGRIVKAQKANKLSSEFLLAYILPLIAFDFGDLKSVVLFLTYFAILAFLCIRNNNIYTNVMLELKNYRIYSCDVERPIPGDKKVIYYGSLFISKDDLTSADDNKIKFWDCDNDIYIHIKEIDEDE